MTPNVRQLTHEVYTWDGLELVRRDLYDAAVEELDRLRSAAEALPSPDDLMTMANDLDYISRTLDRASRGIMGHVRVWATADLPNLRRIINTLRRAALHREDGT